jgi:hypothetical protein
MQESGWGRDPGLYLVYLFLRLLVLISYIDAKRSQGINNMRVSASDSPSVQVSMVLFLLFTSR